MSEGEAAEEVVVAETPAVLGKRTRKQTTFFDVPVSVSEREGEKGKGEGETETEGEGVKLGDYPHFVSELEKLRGDDEVVKGLHALLFGNPGKRLQTKKNLRAFSGFPSSTSAADKLAKVVDKKKLWTVANLKVALGLFGLEKSGDREVLCKRLVDYLAKPDIHKEVKKGGAKKGGTSKKKAKSESGPPKKKRSLTSFMIFSNEKRGEVLAKNEGIAFGEVGKKLGEMWGALSDSAKKVWQDKAAAAKAAAAEGEEASVAEEEEEEEEEEEDREESGDRGAVDGAENDPFQSDDDA